MILFKQVLLSNKVYRNVRHFSIHWQSDSTNFMIATSWALQPGDWWKHDGEEKAKFFSAHWRNKTEKHEQTGLFIGRLAIVFQTMDRNKPIGPSKASMGLLLNQDWE